MYRLGVLPLDAYRLYLILGAIWAVSSRMIFTVLAVYYVRTVGMNPLQLVLVGTMVEGTILLFEVPTGVLADAYSRRVSVIVGYSLVGLCYVIQGLVPLFYIILLAEFIRGIGETFISGALTAWIADEVGEERVGTAYLRNSQVMQISGIVGILLGTMLAVYQLNLPVYLGGALIMGLSLFLVFTMPEDGFTPTPRTERSTWGEMYTITRQGLHIARWQPVVFMFLLVAIVFGTFSEGLDRLWEAHFLGNFAFPAWGNWQPVVWIGIINIGATLLGILTTEVLLRRMDMRNPKILSRALFAITGVLMVSVITFGLAPIFWVAVAAFWLTAVSRTLLYPISATWLNRNISTSVRATVLSIIGQADALGQIAGGPLMGAIGLRSLRLVMFLAGILLSPALALYGRGIRLADKQADDEKNDAEDGNVLVDDSLPNDLLPK